MTFKIPYPHTKAGCKDWSKKYGMNAYYTGKHWSRRQEDARYWHGLVLSELRAQGIRKRMFQKPVTVTFYWNDRMDIDNHAVMGKMIVDALKGVVITDDNRQWLKGVSHFWHDENYILVEVKECGV